MRVRKEKESSLSRVFGSSAPNLSICSGPTDWGTDAGQYVGVEDCADCRNGLLGHGEDKQANGSSVTHAEQGGLAIGADNVDRCVGRDLVRNAYQVPGDPPRTVQRATSRSNLAATVCPKDDICRKDLSQPTTSPDSRAAT